MRDATIEIIDEVLVHPDADRLEICQILGFQCISEKGLYKGGEKIVYIRPDSLLPIELWTEGYRKYAPKRIKVVRLRGVASKGIIVPFEILPQEIQDKLATMNVGEDVSELIGVVHYEEPQPQDLQAKGGLPFGIPKTDEERHENLRRNLPLGQRGDVTLKVDGQSCSFFYDNETDKFGVLGRTFEYHEIFSNNYTAHITRYDIKTKLIEYCKKYNVSLCVRGESYGQGIQSFENNPYSKLEKGWAMFAVWSITDHDHAEKEHPHYFLNVAKETGFPTVPVLEEDVEITQELLDKYSKVLSKINGKPFEGVVVKHAKGSFKIINDDYDSKK